MKIIKSTPRPGGKTRLIIELDADERIQPHKDVHVILAASAGRTMLNIDPDAHYRLGEPMRDDIIAGHILADAVRVHWCSLEQEWKD